MNNLKKVLCLSVCVTFGAVCFTVSANAQTRDRVVKPTSSQPTNMPPSAAEQTRPQPASRPTLTNPIIVVSPARSESKPLVTRTSSSKAVNSPAAMASAGRSVYAMSTSLKIDNAIKSRYGIRYVYGTAGPNTYDCSGFVWSVFQEVGIDFTRSSARSMWSMSDPVYGDERFKYGTLVFLNNFGHMGIVADENGFYHASSSKGITYSPFAGYWQNRIVGFGRLKPQYTNTQSGNQDDR
ncbi:MAG: C40 family peptidase [Pyrinomonadaceae bacterium]|nr:C40 family peptidase [Acidobacteriota bacterium]MBP7377561.1 C40 family peptidase [Pyrinomonadaceae bacterium]